MNGQVHPVRQEFLALCLGFQLDNGCAYNDIAQWESLHLIA